MSLSYYNKPFSPDLIAGAFRAFFRILLVLLAIFLTFFIFIPLNCLLPPSLKGKNRCRFQKFLMGLILAILGVRIIRKGTPPKGRFFFIANHLGVIDVFAVMAETGARLIAKESLSRIPVFSYFMGQFGVIFIKRDSLSDMKRVSEEMKGAYEQGEGVAFFPEGTTSRGRGVRVFLGALFYPAVLTAAPVYYGAIRFHVPSPRWPIASVSACQTEGSRFIHHLILLAFLPRIEVHISYGDEPVEGTGRKALVHELEKRMLAQFEPMEQLPDEELRRLFPPSARESQTLKARPFLRGDD